MSFNVRYDGVKVGFVEVELEKNSWVDVNEIEGVGGLEGLEFMLNEEFEDGTYYIVYKYINDRNAVIYLIKDNEGAFEKADKIAGKLYRNEIVLDNVDYMIEL